jgi:hypothetical protein
MEIEETCLTDTYKNVRQVANWSFEAAIPSEKMENKYFSKAAKSNRKPKRMENLLNTAKMF